MDQKTGSVSQLTGESLKSQFIKLIKKQKKFPLFVAEGDSRKKLRRIHSSGYLTWCMIEYTKNGASPALLNTLNRNICVVGHQCHVMPSGNKGLTAVFVAHIPHKPPPTVLVSYMFSNMTSLGWLEGLKRCRNPDCQNFFLGRRNVKWCEKSCGSLYRVRQKRKRDRS